MISEIRLFTRVTVAKANAVVENPDEPADPEGGFAEWAMLTLHALRIELGTSYYMTLNLLSDLSSRNSGCRGCHYTLFRGWIGTVPTTVWAFLGVSAE